MVDVNPAPSIFKKVALMSAVEFLGKVGLLPSKSNEKGPTRILKTLEESSPSPQKLHSKLKMHVFIAMAQDHQRKCSNGWKACF